MTLRYEARHRLNADSHFVPWTGVIYQCRCCQVFKDTTYYKGWMTIVSCISCVILNTKHHFDITSNELTCFALLAASRNESGSVDVPWCFACSFLVFLGIKKRFKWQRGYCPHSGGPCRFVPSLPGPMFSLYINATFYITLQITAFPANLVLLFCFVILVNY